MKDKELVEQLIENGFNYFDYVPCSNLKGIINILNSQFCDMVNTSNNEGECLSNAFAATLAGKKAVVLLQNSGIGNLLNPYTSLIKTYKAQIFFIIGFRGSDNNDEIQHEFMGAITERLLDLMDLKYQIIRKTDTKIDFAKDCLLIKNDTIENTVKPEDFNTNELSYEDIINEVVNCNHYNYHIFSTTGFISRTLFEIKDCNKNFYNVGAMGNVSAIAKTFNIIQNEPTIVLDGDGSFLMRLENNIMTTLIENKYIYILLNNETYNSTGAQKTNIATLDLKLLSKSFGFEKFYEIRTFKDLKRLYKIFNMNHLKIFINCHINNLHKDLPRIKFENICHWTTHKKY